MLCLLIILIFGREYLTIHLSSIGSMPTWGLHIINESLISDDINGVDHEGAKPSISYGTLLTVDEVAKIFRLKPETIGSMAQRGDLPAIKLGRVWRFRSSSITQMIDD